MIVSPGCFYAHPASLRSAVTGWVGAWLTAEGDSLYNSRCDISIPADKLVDNQDFEFFSENWLLGID